jgi:hypothetical protein
MSDENLRLAERLTAIASALRPKTNEPDAFTAEQRRAPATWGDVEDVAMMIADKIGKEIAALKAGLASKSEYRGVWKETATYKPNDEVTFKGQLWACEAPNSSTRPGTNSDWKLKHKRESL